MWLPSPSRFDGCAERALARCGGMSTGDGASLQWKPPVTLAPPSVRRAGAAVQRVMAAASEAPAPAYVSAPASSSPSELRQCGAFGCTLLDNHTGLCNIGLLHGRSEEEIFMQEISEIHAEISEGATARPSTDDPSDLEDVEDHVVLGGTVRDFWTRL